MRRDHPFVPFRIADLAATVTPKHVHHGHVDMRASSNSALEDAVHIVDKEIQRSGSVANSIGTQAVLLSRLRAEHQRGLTKAQFGMHRTFRTIHYGTDRKSKRVRIEIHRSAD